MRRFAAFLSAVPHDALGSRRTTAPALLRPGDSSGAALEHTTHSQHTAAARANPKMGRAARALRARRRRVRLGRRRAHAARVGGVARAHQPPVHHAGPRLALHAPPRAPRPVPTPPRAVLYARGVVPHTLAQHPLFA